MSKTIVLIKIAILKSKLYITNRVISFISVVIDKPA